jgi:hypothetical protein
MTKKFWFCLLAAALSAGALGAQTIALEGGVNSLGLLTFSNAVPKLGVEVTFPKFIIMGQLDGYVDRTKEEWASSPYSLTTTRWNLGITGGIAPVAAASGNWRLTLPLLARLGYGKDTQKSDAPGNVTREDKTLELTLRAGARAAYTLSERWSLYTGFMLNVVNWTKTEGTLNVGIPTNKGTDTNLLVFQNPRWELGVLFKL